MLAGPSRMLKRARKSDLEANDLNNMFNLQMIRRKLLHAAIF